MTDRLDNEKGYSKENCRWATHAEQARNKRNVRLFDYKGAKATVADIARDVGLKRNTLYSRLFVYNWPFEKAVQV